MQLYKTIPFKARPRPVLKAPAYGPPISGLRMGNVKNGPLSDYINSPGLPGSSTFWMYGLNDDGTDDSGSDATSFFSTLTQGITDITKAVAPAYVQVQLAKINAERLKQGLPPLTQVPALGVQGSLAPSTIGAGFGGILLIGALGLGAILLLKRK